MFSNSQVMVTVPCTSLDNCRNFYENTLGLTPAQTDAPAGGMVYEAGAGSQIYIYETQSTGGTATRFAFLTDDFDSDVQRLKSNNVTLQDYDLPEIQGTAADTMQMTKVEPGIFQDPQWGKACWFADPDGNVINLMENVSQAKRAAA